MYFREAIKMRISLLLAGFLLAVPALSQAKTLEELLVEKGVITKNEASMTDGEAPGFIIWKDGTRINYPSEGVTASVTTLLQERYTYSDNDEDSGEKNTSSFDTRRARVFLSGTALNEEFAYMLQADFVGDSDETKDNQKSPSMKDAYIVWKPCDGMAFKFGQMRTAVSRQYNTSPAKLQFVERSVVSDYMQLGRQQGLLATQELVDGMVEVGAGIYNGESDGEGENLSGVDTRQTGIVNMRVNAMGKTNSHNEGDESDLDYTEDMAVSFGGAYAHSSANNDLGAGLEHTNRDTVSVDANLKSEGLSLHAEYFYQNQDADSFTDSVDANGFYAQAGYFLDPKTLEVAARYAFLDCDNGKASGECSGNDSINQVAATINYYFKKHNLKAQFGYEFNNEDTATSNGEDINTTKWVFQLSAYM